MSQKQEKYDVVILGSGIGGLCCAALLANKGYKTLVAEKMPMIGGRCSTLAYKGFKIPTGVVAVPMSGVLKSVFDEVGADFDVSPITVLPKYLIDNKIIDEPADGQPLSILSCFCTDKKEVSMLQKGIERAQTWNAPSNETSLLDFLYQYTKNENLISYFNNKCDIFFTVGAHEASAREYFLSHTGILKDFQPIGFANQGSISLMKALKKVIEDKGGKVLTQCRAKKILVKNQIAEGVVVEGIKGETTIMATAVVSNTGPKKTVALAGKEHFDKGYLKEVINMVPSFQMWVTTISDRPLFDIPFLFTLKTKRLLTFLSASLVSPGLAPEGKYIHYSISGPASQTGPWNLQNEVDLHIQDLKDNIPDFNKYGKILHVGCYWGELPTYSNTPITGFHNIPQKTAVENLYNVGDGVSKEDGFSCGSPGCALTARIVAEDIKNRFKP
ncbi:MAG: NAD(P)/FAD-dependent oxidoreductase [Desulfobacterium sp.]|nr:NAD(P)/FAD-dependent oxidoreductase [Desulfobacterium sp.]MBU3950106.1 NAD(P)-binding protein [Pseudomonadota bacterium]MBU4010762.1 NAD(P)-binding protein [Pseudomonadota bacterium]MBU4037502.1 NAD(P)-binding protein [Pseudomonadota bacterium]